MKNFYFTAQVKLIALFVVLTAFTTTVKAQQYTLTDDDVVVTDGVIQSCSYDFAVKDIVIPETLDGQTVVEIAENFNGVFESKGIVKVKLPSKLTKIGRNAFRSNFLTTVTIPQGVKTIGTGVFVNNNLTSVTLAISVTRIGRYAFFGNSNLASITLPTPKIDGLSFFNWIDTKGNTYAGGTAVEDFEVGYTAELEYTLTDNDVVVTDGVIESCIYDFTATSIIIPETLDGQTVTAIADKGWYTGVFYNKGIVKVKLPSTITKIGKNAFNLNDLTAITIPQGVTIIGSGAFYINNLIKLSIPSSVTVIGNSAFGYNKINILTLSEGLTEIGLEVFSGNQLSSVTIPSSVKTIGKGAFKQNKISELKLSDVLTEIGEEVFMNNRIISLIIPENIKSIGKSAFWGNCINELTLSEGLNSIGEGAFVWSNLTELTIPNSVKSIGSQSFYGNELTNVTLGASVTEIGGGAFYYNSELSSITLSIPEIEGYPFKYWIDSNGKTYSGGDLMTDFAVSYKAELEVTSFLIKGKVTGADGVLIKLTGDATNDKTVDNGQEYFFTVNYGQSVEITATREGYSFAPDKYSFTDVKENKADNNFTATLVALPVTFTITDGTNPITGATVTFNGASYTTNSTGVVVIENVKPGNYPYTIKANGFADKSGNITVSTEKVTTVIPLSKLTAIDSVNGLNVSVYPNPVNNTLFIELPTDNNIASVHISDVTGKVLYQAMNITDKVLSVDVSEFNSGILIVKVTNNKGVSDIRKVIKK